MEKENREKETVKQAPTPSTFVGRKRRAQSTAHSIPSLQQDHSRQSHSFGVIRKGRRVIIFLQDFLSRFSRLKREEPFNASTESFDIRSFIQREFSPDQVEEQEIHHETKLEQESASESNQLEDIRIVIEGWNKADKQKRETLQSQTQTPIFHQHEEGIRRDGTEESRLEEEEMEVMIDQGKPRKSQKSKEPQEEPQPPPLPSKSGISELSRRLTSEREVDLRASVESSEFRAPPLCLLKSPLNLVLLLSLAPSLFQRVILPKPTDRLRCLSWN